MKKHVAQGSALLLTLTLLLAFCVGCGKDNAPSDPTDSSGISQSPSGTPDDSSDPQSSDADGDHSGTGTGGGQSDTGKNTTTKNTTTKTSSSGSKDRPTDASSLRGTTVRFPFWKNVGGEINQAAINGFQKKYGIKVKLELVPQDQYISNIAGKISAQNAPDVYWSNGDFPACLGDLQPLSAGNVDLSDAIWDKNITKATTINGKTYLVNSASNVDASLVYYNKKLFSSNNLKTPQEYVDEGNWTWETMTRVMESVKGLGSSYVGGYVDCEQFWASYGVSFYLYDNGQFSSGLNADLTKAMTQLSTWLDNGLMHGIGLDYRDEFVNGKVGLAFEGIFGLKKYGYWSKMDASHIGFVEIPSIDGSTKPTYGKALSGWGICKGASNPQGAGLFIRYYADLSNHDLSNDYLSSEAQKFAMKVANRSTNFYPLMTGCSHTLGQDRFTYWNIVKNKPEQVQQTLRSMANQVNEGVDRLNARMKDF